MRNFFLLDSFNSMILIKKPATVLLKVLFTLVLIGAIEYKGDCQIVKESFSYPPHITNGLASQSGGVWTVANSGDSILIESGSLSYQGLENSSGNKVTFGGPGADYFRPFAIQNSGIVYSSFLLNISSLGSLNTTGGYAIGFADGSTNFGSTVWLRLSGSNFNIGLNTRTTAANTQWLPNLLNVNQTYLVVISYEFISSTGNDIVKLWLNPTSLGSNEPTPDVSSINSGGTDLNNVQRFFLRQDAVSATPAVMLVDELRVGNTWAAVTPTGSTSSTISVSPGNNASEPSTNGNFIINFSSPTTVTTDVNFAFTGTAGFGTDYTISYSAGTTISSSSAGTLSVPAGTSSITVSVNPIDDTEFEGTESVTLTLSDAIGDYILGTASASIIITDNDAPPSASVTAGNNAAEPSTDGTFIINFSEPAPNGGVTVTYSLNGSAILGTDYTDVLSGTITIPVGLSAGTITITVIDDEILEGPETIDINLISASNGFTLGTSTASITLIDNEIAPVPKVVINEVYGGGGNSGATYKNDFIELYNNEDYSVNLNGWSVQYASATGTSWTATALSGTIPAKGYYLIQQAAGAGGTANLPTPDATGTLNMSGTAGKVALVNITTSLSGVCPSGTNIIDLVGFGSTASCFEGSAPTVAPSNSSSVQRKIKGFDTNDNKEDFKLNDPPTPLNSIADITPPVIVSTFPTDDATGTMTSFTASIQFSENLQKGTAGSIKVKSSDGTVLSELDITSSALTVSGSVVRFNIHSLEFNSTYYIEISEGAFLDISDNEFAGISDATTWNFQTIATPLTGALNTVYDFNSCSTQLLDGFSQFSQTGDIIWGCTPFGRDPDAPTGTAQFPNAIQMNGFANNTNVPNVDWFISPAFDLTGTTYPLLSFWSRTAFNGLPLQLMVSTDYSGTGDPANATWSELNGKFPNLASNTWTLSDNINLSAFKASNVYIGFVYTSTSDDGARWTLDDFSIINSSTPPPPSLTVSTSDLQFQFVQGGSTGEKTFTFIGNDLTGNVTLTATGSFLLSKDGTSFSTSIEYNVNEVNDLFTTVHVQFAPPSANENYTGSVSVSSSGLEAFINTKGSSIDPALTLEVVNWNVEWFGHLGNGPSNETLQEQNVLKIMKSINADVYALMEIVDEAKLARVVSQLDGYDYVISNFGSHTNTSRNPPSALAEAQKMAFVYKTSVITNLNTRALLSQGINTAEDVNHPYYNHWSSGRFPYMMDADVKLGDLTKNVKFILVHAKANTSPVDVSYNRRKAGADVLYDSLKILFPDDHLIMLGDFNDDLDQSITAGFTTTSWNKFTEDNVEYEPITLPLSLAGKKSTVAYNDIIDHVVISNEMKRWYMSSTASILTDVTSLVSNYGSTTSDHYPVFSRYIYCNITSPENIVVNNDEGQCGAVVNYSFTNTQTCGIVTADIESGSFFEAGTHTVTLTSSYGDVATFTITVIDNEKPIISHNGNKNVNTDAGKCGASVLVTATASDNCGGELTVTGSRSDELELDADYPVGSTTITWTVTDINGNLATTEQIINVADDEKPAITPPAAINTNADAEQCYATISSLGTPVTNDNCGIESVTNDAPATFPVGNTTVTWIVKDIYGNIATAEQVVTVTDAQLPIIISCPSVPVQCYNSNNIYTIPQLIASDNCGIESIEFTITGTTTRSGNSNNASGTFNIGTSTILWTVTDVNANKTTCQTTVIINSPVNSSIPDAYSITPGSAPNTVYIGYAQASSITLYAQLSGGTAPYAYKWTVGTSSGRGFSNASSITVNPTTSSTYYLNVEDVYGCVTNATTKTVNVVDVRCGPKSDKVSVCQLNKGKWTTSCVLSKDVPDLLASGAILGSCSNTPSSVITYAEPVLELESKGLQVLAMPNPSSAFFNIRIQSVNNSERTFVRITDILGRTIEQFQNVPSTHVLRIGDNYKNGVYLVEVIQGTFRKQLKIIKNQ